MWKQLRRAAAERRAARDRCLAECRAKRAVAAAARQSALPTKAAAAPHTAWLACFSSPGKQCGGEEVESHGSDASAPVDSSPSMAAGSTQAGGGTCPRHLNRLQSLSLDESYDAYLAHQVGATCAASAVHLHLHKQ